jgi:hypothetical protein
MSELEGDGERSDFRFGFRVQRDFRHLAIDGKPSTRRTNVLRRRNVQEHENLSTGKISTFQ